MARITEPPCNVYARCVECAKKVTECTCGRPPGWFGPDHMEHFTGCPDGVLLVGTECRDGGEQGGANVS